MESQNASRFQDLKFLHKTTCNCGAFASYLKWTPLFTNARGYWALGTVLLNCLSWIFAMLLGFMGECVVSFSKSWKALVAFQHNILLLWENGV